MKGYYQDVPELEEGKPDLSTLGHEQDCFHTIAERRGKNGKPVYELFLWCRKIHPLIRLRKLLGRKR